METRLCAHCAQPLVQKQREKQHAFMVRKFCTRSCAMLFRGSLNPAVRERLAANSVISEGGCWEWQAIIDKYGYGRLSVNGKSRLAHRLAYVEYRGSIPDGRLVCHSCDNRKCVNPDHLFLGTNADNMADRNAKARQARGERSKRSTLTEADIRAIRVSSDSEVRLAKQFGISPETARRIRLRVYWRHVT